MEKPPVKVSHSEYLELTNIDHLNRYTELIGKINNSKDRYGIIDNDVRLDTFGNPYIIFHYYEIPEVKERKIPGFTFFGEIISMSNLDKFDSLITDHWAEKIKLIYLQEFSNRDKEAPMIYKLVIYYKTKNGKQLTEEEKQLLSPRQSKGNL